MKPTKIIIHVTAPLIGRPIVTRVLFDGKMGPKRSHPRTKALKPKVLQIDLVMPHELDGAKCVVSDDVIWCPHEALG